MHFVSLTMHINYLPYVTNCLVFWWKHTVFSLKYKLIPYLKFILEILISYFNALLLGL